jgi:hypothetical protein
VAKGASDQNTPASWNKYAYTLGDPVNNVDPQGMFLPICDPSEGSCGGDGGWGWGPPCTLLTVDPEGCEIDAPGSVQTQGNTNRAGDLTVDPYSNNMGGSFQDAITRMLQNISGALASNPKCNTWLSSGSLGSAAGVISVLVQNNAYGYGDFFIGGVQTYTIAGAEGGHNLDGTSTGILGAFAINSQGAFFNSTAPGGGTLTVGAANYTGGTPQAQAAILIHELGHVLGLLGPDYGNNGAGSANDKTVAANCAALINSLGKN